MRKSPTQTPQNPRTGTNQNTSPIPMPPSLTTGMMIWTASGSHQWLTTQSSKVAFSHSFCFERYQRFYSSCLKLISGDWKPPMIKNPAYKGKWVHPEIDNPDYAPDSEIYSFADFGRIGLDLWQVRLKEVNP